MFPIRYNNLEELRELKRLDWESCVLSFLTTGDISNNFEYKAYFLKSDCLFKSLYIASANIRFALLFGWISIW